MTAGNRPDDPEARRRVKQTEKNLVEAKRRNTGVQPAGQADLAEQTARRERLPNPGQVIVNSDQSDA